MINRYEIFDTSNREVFTILTENGLLWSGMKMSPTLHVGSVCIPITRKAAVKAFKRAIESGYTVKAEFDV